MVNLGIGSNFGTSPIWPQCGGDRLIQVTAKAGSTVPVSVHGEHEHIMSRLGVLLLVLEVPTLAC